MDALTTKNRRFYICLKSLAVAWVFCPILVLIPAVVYFEDPSRTSTEKYKIGKNYTQIFKNKILMPKYSTM